MPKKADPEFADHEINSELVNMCSHVRKGFLIQNVFFMLNLHSIVPI